MNPEGRVVWSGIDSTCILAQVRISFPSDPRIPYGKTESRVSGEVIRASVSCSPPEPPGAGETPDKPAG